MSTTPDHPIAGRINPAPAAAPAHESDRRRAERVSVIRGCKLMHERFGGGLVAATTANFSNGGALLRLERVRPVCKGDKVSVAIDWRGVGVLTESAMLPARVVRVTPMDHHHQAVAVEFDHAMSAAVAA